jgi:hypothetical protein
MSDYGSKEYSKGVYGGSADPFNLSGKTGIVIEVYDPNGTFKAIYQSGSSTLLGIEFSIDTSGPRDFTLRFGGFVDIDKKDQIKIKIFNSNDYFFTGVVRRIPIEGSTEQRYEYSGFGFNDYLIRANTENQSYAADNVYDIVDDLLDTIITDKTPIIKNVAKLDTSLQSIDVTAIDFNYVTCQEAMEQLKALAQSDGNEYVVGVDTEGDFFFKRRSATVEATLVVGKNGRYGIPEYNPQDNIEQRTKYFVLNSSGTYITTITSTEDNDIWEEKITAPDIDNADIPNWAQGQMTQAEIITRTAGILWKIADESPELIIGDGQIRIISNIAPPLGSGADWTGWGAGTWGSGVWGGGSYEGYDLDDTLRILEVKYKITSQQATREIQLGGIAVDLENIVVSVNKNLQDLRVSLGR